MLTRVTSEFQITSCQCNKDKKIVHNAAMGQNAEVLGDFFPLDDSFVLKRCDDSRNDPSKYSHPVADVRQQYARIGKKDIKQSKLIVRRIIVF